MFQMSYTQRRSCSDPGIGQKEWAAHICLKHCAVSSTGYLTQPSDPAWGLAEPSPADTPDVPEGGQFLVRSYSNQAGTRAYKLYVPSGYHGQPLPLIVDAHQAEVEADDRGQEEPRGPSFLTSPIALCQNPDVAYELS